MANNTSQHILGTASNLLGFCLFVITSLHIANQSESHYIDELTSVVAVILTISCLFSFSAIRSNDQRRENLYESVADYLFVISLVGILVIILLITLNFIE